MKKTVGTYNKKVVLSGIRATGKLHLGNYLGAMKDFATLSHDNEKQCFFFVANLHTITTRINPGEIKHDLQQIVLDYLSVGVDPEKSVIYAQSSIPETTELMWMLNCISTVAELERLPHFKEKKGKIAEKENVCAGLLNYPILMAADILGPSADLVPVGEDQEPHVELTRELARRFNFTFGETFVIPHILSQDPIRVPGLDGAGKMGKSDNNTIDLSDPPDIVKAKLARAVTDTNRRRRSDPGNPDLCNIYTLHTLLSGGETLLEIRQGCSSAGIGCLDCKHIIASAISNILSPIQAKRAELEAKGKNYPCDILRDGGERARKVIAAKVAEAKEKMGIPFY